MKKITLSIGLVAAILSAKAQDTTCTYFKGKRVLEFDYQTSEILFEVEQKTRYYDIEVKYGNILCLDLTPEELATLIDKATFAYQGIKDFDRDDTEPDQYNRTH